MDEVKKMEDGKSHGNRQSTDDERLHGGDPPGKTHSAGADYIDNRRSKEAIFKECFESSVGAMLSMLTALTTVMIVTAFVFFVVPQAPDEIKGMLFAICVAEFVAVWIAGRLYLDLKEHFKGDCDIDINFTFLGRELFRIRRKL